jgi:hypothetical protein
MILQTGMELSDSNSAKKAETDDVLNNETNENAWRKRHPTESANRPYDGTKNIRAYFGAILLVWPNVVC